MKFKKIRAGALQLTMFIIVVIALLLASFIVLIHTHKQFNVQTDFVLETVDNAQRGIAYALQNALTLNEETSISLNNEDYKILSIKRDFWGVFEKVIATAAIKTKSFTKTALIGTSQPELNRTALYVKDNNKPLVLVGNTKIQGTTYLPKRGVRPGNISGVSYYGSKLIFGNTKTSSRFPELSSGSLQQIKTLCNKDIDIPRSQFLETNRETVYGNSFLEPLKVVYSDGIINLIGIDLTGHIRIQSKTKIIVDSSSQLKDVLLIAPEIDIKNGVKGRFQAIASKSIRVGKNCKLDYPSALVVNEKEKTIANKTVQTEIHEIIIDKNSNIKGVILFLGQSKTNNYNPQIVIEENVTIKGEVYCSQNLELKGTVYGSVFTNNFIAAQSGSKYQNHIYSGTINVDKLPLEYVGLAFKNSRKSVLKWLY